MPDRPIVTSLPSGPPDGDRECYQFAFDAECLALLRGERPPVADVAASATRRAVTSVPLFVADVEAEDR